VPVLFGGPDATRTHGLPLVVDNIVATPVLFSRLERNLLDGKKMEKVGPLSALEMAIAEKGQAGTLSCAGL